MPVKRQLFRGCLACLRVVVTLAINRRYSRPHRTQVRRKLAPVMDRVVQSHHHKSDRRPLEHTAKIHHFHQLLAGRLRQCIKILCEPLLIPPRNLRGSFHAVWNHSRIRIECSVDRRFQKAVIRGGNVPRQLDRAPRRRIWPMLALVRWHRLDDFFRNSALVFQCPQVNVLQQKHRMLACHFLHFFFLLCALLDRSLLMQTRSHHLAAKAARRFKQRQQVGNSEELADLRICIHQLKCTAACSGRNVQTYDGPKSRAVHQRALFQVQNNSLVVWNPLPDCTFQKRRILHRQFAVAFHHGRVFPEITMHSEAARRTVCQVLCHFNPYSTAQNSTSLDESLVKMAKKKDRRCPRRKLRQVSERRRRVALENQGPRPCRPPAEVQERPRKMAR